MYVILGILLSGNSCKWSCVVEKNAAGEVRFFQRDSANFAENLTNTQKSSDVAYTSEQRAH